MTQFLLVTVIKLIYIFRDAVIIRYSLKHHVAHSWQHGAQDLCCFSESSDEDSKGSHYRRWR